MSILKTIIKIAAPPPKIEEFDRFLFIGPHPDDIEIGAGATAAKLASLGKKVCFLICIDGRYGTENSPSVPPEEMLVTRKKEAIRSAALLGVDDVRFLGYRDGGFYSYDNLICSIAEIVGDFAPDVIFAPDPCVTSECHQDHLNVGTAARQVAYFAPYDNIMVNMEAKPAEVKALAYYMTAKPNRYVNTTGFFDRQLDSIFTCHLSQFPEGCEAAKSISLYLKLRAYDYGIRNLCRTADGFRVLSQTMMHCLPEAGD